MGRFAFICMRMLNLHSCVVCRAIKAVGQKHLRLYEANAWLACGIRAGASVRSVAPTFSFVQRGAASIDFLVVFRATLLTCLCLMGAVHSVCQQSRSSRK